MSRRKPWYSCSVIVFTGTVSVDKHHRPPYEKSPKAQITFLDALSNNSGTMFTF